MLTAGRVGAGGGAGGGEGEGGGVGGAGGGEGGGEGEGGGGGRTEPAAGIKSTVLYASATCDITLEEGLLAKSMHWSPSLDIPHS